MKTETWKTNKKGGFSEGDFHGERTAHWVQSLKLLMRTGFLSFIWCSDNILSTSESDIHFITFFTFHILTYVNHNKKEKGLKL